MTDSERAARIQAGKVPMPDPRNEPRRDPYDSPSLIGNYPPLDAGGALPVGKVTLISEQPEQLRKAMLEIDRLRVALMAIENVELEWEARSREVKRIAREALSR